MATVYPCSHKKEETDLHFVVPGLIILVGHKHHSHFSFNNRRFFWKGHKELMEDDKVKNAAKFEPTCFEGHSDRIGVLGVEQVDVQDIAVVTAFAVQERDEEFKSKVKIS
jgi:hypothetical protein